MVNGYDDSNYGLGTNTASQARELKRQRIDSPVDGLQAQPGRCCFVTVGATAGFRSLLNEITTAGFLDCLAKHGYTSLNIQCGPDLTTVESRIASLSDDEKRGISVRCFHYTDEMTTHIVNCRGQDGVRLAGCVIAHGGKFCSRLELVRLSSVLITSYLTLYFRHWNCRRGTGHRRTTSRRCKPDLDGQPPTRASRDPRSPKPSRPRPHRVSTPSPLPPPLLNPHFSRDSAFHRSS